MCRKLFKYADIKVDFLFIYFLFRFYIDDIPYDIKPIDYLLGIKESGDIETLYAEYDNRFSDC